MEMYEAKDKVVLVTGAGGTNGIGACVVRAFLKEGAKHVAILDLDINGRTLEDELAAKHGAEKVKFYKCDVTSDDLNEAYQDVLENFGYIDVVVNNAGIFLHELESFETSIAINLTALIASSIKAFDLMRKDRQGRGGTIVNVASIAALRLAEHFTIYSTTKCAVLQFSNSLGNEHRFSHTGVRVITMCFGATETSLFKATRNDRIDDMGLTQERIEKIIKKNNKRVPQKPESAANGLIEAYKHGASGSVWLVTHDRPAEDITADIIKGYEIMSQRVLDN